MFDDDPDGLAFQEGWDRHEPETDLDYWDEYADNEAQKWEDYRAARAAHPAGKGRHDPALPIMFISLFFVFCALIGFVVLFDRFSLAVGAIVAALGVWCWEVCR